MCKQIRDKESVIRIRLPPPGNVQLTYRFAYERTEEDKRPEQAGHVRLRDSGGVYCRHRAGRHGDQVDPGREGLDGRFVLLTSTGASCGSGASTSPNMPGDVQQPCAAPRPQAAAHGPRAGEAAARLAGPGTDDCGAAALSTTGGWRRSSSGWPAAASRTTSANTSRRTTPAARWTRQ